MGNEGQGHNASDVAAYLIWRTIDMGRPKTLLDHLNLLYLSHAWSLAIRDTPLCQQEFRVSRWGPRIDGAFGSLQEKGVHLVADLPTELPLTKGVLSPSDRQFIESVLRAYIDTETWMIQALVTVPDGPWDRTRMTKGEGRVISNRLITDHFKTILAQQQT